ncbi:MAG TPA: GNAT family N-acetyltransferase [Gammaproteobacteria bacterium]|nr:GNAT family N-acetyltransferase [Xanthomonadales bacterium]MCB1593472.1 GNAT family N-acetyltransferase [Xanthomonadales bacterium]HPI96344.1 GNAT family N-acetyltransferase [Gammaproteobacteria bacterium]HPQ87758.1 GNAT family N-acetyltransferase [Gammaproteobacteria bacterium]
MKLENSIIRLELLTEDDREFYNSIYTDDSLTRYISKPLSISSSNKSFEVVIKKMSGIKSRLMIYKISSIVDNCNIGIIGLKWNCQHPDDAEIGIIILKQFQRKGLSHSSKTLLMQQAFNNLNTRKIIARCHKDNIPANKANQKLGFKRVSEKMNSQIDSIQVTWEISQKDFRIMTHET